MYHITQNCYSKIRCSVCNGKHHITICKEKSQEPAARDAKGKDSDQYTHVGAADMTKTGTGILLPSAMVTSVIAFSRHWLLSVIGLNTNQLWRHVAQSCTSGDKASLQIFVAATCRINSDWLNFVGHVAGKKVLQNSCCMSLKMIVQMRGQVAATCPRWFFLCAHAVILSLLHVSATLARNMLLREHRT